MYLKFHTFQSSTLEGAHSSFPLRVVQNVVSCCDFDQHIFLSAVPTKFCLLCVIPRIKDCAYCVLIVRFVETMCDIIDHQDLCSKNLFFRNHERGGCIPMVHSVEVCFALLQR